MNKQVPKTETPIKNRRTRKSKKEATIVDVKEPKKPYSKKSEEEAYEVARGVDGATYQINVRTKTCKRVFTDLSELSELSGDLNEKEFTPTLTTYRNYLKDTFGEDARIKKGKLFFRGYRIHFTDDMGFVIDDFKNNVLNIDTDFEGIPTPKELGKFFSKTSIVTHTDEELKAAVKRGKVEPTKILSMEEKKLLVITKLEGILTGKVVGFDVETVPNMINWKRWIKAITSEISLWKNRKIRYKTLIQNMIDITESESFSDEPVKPKYKFVGTLLPEFKTVGDLKGNKIEVDGIMKDAVPFLQNYILYYEPDAMYQLMRFAEGEIELLELLQDPMGGDTDIEFNSKKLKNTEDNARVLTLLCASLDLAAPQDMVYGGLEIGDKILICFDGEWYRDTVMSVAEGIELTKGVGLLKSDKWLLVEKAVKEEPIIEKVTEAEII